MLGVNLSHLKTIVSKGLTSLTNVAKSGSYQSGEKLLGNNFVAFNRSLSIVENFFLSGLLIIL